MPKTGYYVVYMYTTKLVHHVVYMYTYMCYTCILKCVIDGYHQQITQRGQRRDTM